MTALLGTLIFVPKFVSAILIAYNIHIVTIPYFYEVHCVQIGLVMQCYGYRVVNGNDEDT